MDGLDFTAMCWFPRIEQVSSGGRTRFQAVISLYAVDSETLIERREIGNPWSTYDKAAVAALTALNEVNADSRH